MKYKLDENLYGIDIVHVFKVAHLNLILSGQFVKSDRILDTNIAFYTYYLCQFMYKEHPF